MSHLIADSEEELFAMIDKIEVDRKWYQVDHFDIALVKRTLAIKHGAVEITLRQAGYMMSLRRNFGLPLGDPSTAKDRWQRAYRDYRKGF